MPSLKYDIPFGGFSQGGKNIFSTLSRNLAEKQGKDFLEKAGAQASSHWE
jgi:hypothetical protein